MKKDFSNCKRGFYQNSRAWYSKVVPSNTFSKNFVDDICIGMYMLNNEGTKGEFVIEWSRFDDGEVRPRLIVYDDSWAALLMFKDLFEELAILNNKAPSPDTIKNILIELGIDDITQTERP